VLYSMLAVSRESSHSWRLGYHIQRDTPWSLERFLLCMTQHIPYHTKNIIKVLSFCLSFLPHVLYWRTHSSFDCICHYSSNTVSRNFSFPQNIISIIKGSERNSGINIYRITILKYRKYQENSFSPCNSQYSSNLRALTTVSL
jgi:hypothetical protein